MITMKESLLKLAKLLAEEEKFLKEFSSKNQRMSNMNLLKKVYRGTQKMNL